MRPLYGHKTVYVVVWSWKPGDPVELWDRYREVRTVLVPCRPLLLKYYGGHRQAIEDVGDVVRRHCSAEDSCAWEYRTKLDYLIESII